MTTEGEVLWCDKDRNSDLFHSIPWSYGSLGFLVGAEIKIVPCKSHVALTYHPFTDLESAEKFFVEASKKKENYFIEGLFFGYNEIVLMTGSMCNLSELDKKEKKFEN